MAGEGWAPRQGPSVTGAEASARPPRGRPQSRGHDGNRAGTLTARGHWHLSCRWAPEGRTAVCVWLKWTAHGRGLWGLMPSAGHHPAPQSCRRARQSGGQPLTEGCHLLAGHGDYAYQQASYSEQSYDRSFEESTQHYYEGGTERRGGVGQAAGRAQSGAEPREAALGPGPVGRPVLLLQKLELKLLPALLSLKSESPGPAPRVPWLQSPHILGASQGFARGGRHPCLWAGIGSSGWTQRLLETAPAGSPRCTLAQRAAVLQKTSASLWTTRPRAWRTNSVSSPAGNSQYSQQQAGYQQGAAQQQAGYQQQYPNQQSYPGQQPGYGKRGAAPAHARGAVLAQAPPTRLLGGGVPSAGQLPGPEGPAVALVRPAWPEE